MAASGGGDGVGERPRVAVVGGAHAGGLGDEQAWTAEEAGAVGREIGAAVAEAGCDLVVYSSKPRFIDGHVVAGYLANGPVPAGSVHVRPAFGSSGGRFPEAASQPAAFEHRHEPGDDWEVAFYRSLREVDGLILVGGGRTTLITAMVALAFDIPVAPVAAFGGGGRTAWETLNRVRNQATEEEISALGAAWHPGSTASILATLLGQRRRQREAAAERERLERRAARRSGLGLAASALLLITGLATIPLTYAAGGNAAVNLIALIAGALLTATAGAMTRTAVDRGQDWARAAVLGMSAGAIAVLLFVTAQLATSPDLLTTGGARRLLFFVLSVGFIAGYTFDAVYAKLRQQDVVDTSAVRAVVGTDQEGGSRG
ncbi:hypothetical protein CFP65_6550 [Kitasatospora sp. MMS16-BH015]|uniref:hypothetical protein n=1 Tax=Kitasatospora sp. MMS16-BH015 TaxID=2018025 RepID=UPI000CA1CB84|nr:hypothetical protein [Kitasatospora sp. MMS16-BH015]AUG81200.1 hypothetical protein CFP65_6550 [Kitasatospora sp. MMS16-BH015]